MSDPSRPMPEHLRWLLGALPVFACAAGPFNTPRRNRESTGALLPYACRRAVGTAFLVLRMRPVQSGASVPDIDMIAVPVGVGLTVAATVLRWYRQSTGGQGPEVVPALTEQRT